MTEYMSPLREGFYGLLQLLLPVVCVGCADPGSVLCRSCTHSLSSQPVDDLNRLLPVPARARFRYQTLVRDALVQFKTQGLKVLAKDFGRLVQPLLAAEAGRVGSVQDVVWLIPPLSKKSLQERGFHQVEAVLRRAGIPRNHIISARYVWQPQDQAGLEASLREENLAGTMSFRQSFRQTFRQTFRQGSHASDQEARAADQEARAEFAGRPAILVDDIVTTGATARELLRAALAANFEVSSAVFFANASEIR